MYKLGITGGIGSGKSTASYFFSEKGAIILDADKQAKEYLQKAEAIGGTQNAIEINKIINVISQ